MIKNLRRAAIAAALLVVPVMAPTPPHAQDRPVETYTVPLTAAVHALPLAAEVRDGYERTSFKHWTAGKNPADGCNTRAEVLLSEAVEQPQVLTGCKLSGGRWWSYYDAK